MCACLRALYSALYSLTEHSDFAAHRQRSLGHQIGALAGQLHLIVCRADHQAEGADGLLGLGVLLPRNGKNLSVLKKQMINTSEGGGRTLAVR